MLLSWQKFLVRIIKRWRKLREEKRRKNRGIKERSKTGTKPQRRITCLEPSWYFLLSYFGWWVMVCHNSLNHSEDHILTLCLWVWQLCHDSSLPNQINHIHLSSSLVLGSYNFNHVFNSTISINEIFMFHVSCCCVLRSNLDVLKK